MVVEKRFRIVRQSACASFRFFRKTMWYPRLVDGVDAPVMGS